MTNGTAIAPLHALPRQVSSAACTGRQIALAPNAELERIIEAKK